MFSVCTPEERLKEDPLQFNTVVVTSGLPHQERNILEKFKIWKVL